MTDSSWQAKIDPMRGILSFTLCVFVFAALVAPMAAYAQVTVANAVKPPPLAVVDIDPAVSVSTYTTEDEKLEAILAFVFKNESRRYGWPSNYQALWCPTNVFNLLKRLDQAQVDLSQAHVWYLLPTDEVQDLGDSMIFPRAARSTEAGPTSKWSFHVVLEIKGRILDLDFTSRPEVVSTLDYAAIMWQKGPLANTPDSRPLFVRQIPALEYLAQYSNNWSYYEAGGDGRYPAVEMGALLAKSKSSTR